MSKYVATGIPQKTIGAYLKVVKALNELHSLGEETGFYYVNDCQDLAVSGLIGGIVQNPETGEWTFVQT